DLVLLRLHGPVIIEQQQSNDRADKSEIGIELRRRPGLRWRRGALAAKLGAAHLLQHFRLLRRGGRRPAGSAAELLELFFGGLWRWLRTSAKRLGCILHPLLLCRRWDRRLKIRLLMNHNVP